MFQSRLIYFVFLSLFAPLHASSEPLNGVITTSGGQLATHSTIPIESFENSDAPLNSEGQSGEKDNSSCSTQLSTEFVENTVAFYESDFLFDPTAYVGSRQYLHLSPQIPPPRARFPK